MRAPLKLHPPQDVATACIDHQREAMSRVANIDHAVQDGITAHRARTAITGSANLNGWCAAVHATTDLQSPDPKTADPASSPSPDPVLGFAGAVATLLICAVVVALPIIVYFADWNSPLRDALDAVLLVTSIVWLWFNGSRPASPG